jgi:hypothetical protein
MYPGSFNLYTKKGIEVEPAPALTSLKPIIIDTPKIHLEANSQTFVIRSKTDLINKPVAIPRNDRKADIVRFYKWVQDNQPMVEKLDFMSLLQALMRANIAFHDYESN